MNNFNKLYKITGGIKMEYLMKTSTKVFHIPPLYRGEYGIML
jgi:hypothetical protein